MPDLTEAMLAEALAEFRAEPLPADPRTVGTVRATVRRRRLVQGAMSGVLAAVVVILPAALLVNQHGQPSTPEMPPPTHATASPTASAPATPARPSPAASAAVTTSPTASATGTRTSVDPGAYVPQSWLPAGMLPFDSTYSWVGQTSKPTVMSAPVSGSETSCDGMFNAIVSSGGMNHWQLWVFGNKTTGNQLVSAELGAYQFFYPDASAAQHAFQQIQGQYPSCATERQVDGQTGQSLVNTVTQTAAISNGFAYVHTLRTAAGKPVGSPTLSSDSHEYLVQRGSVVELVEVTAGTATIDNSTDDQGVLQHLVDHLCAANQHC